jgi:ankyrin repeat protein
MYRLPIFTLVLVLGIVQSAAGMEIHDAVISGDLSAVKLVLDSRPHLIDSTNQDHETPLLLAAKYGHLEVVRELLDRGADHTIGDADSSQPIHLAAVGGHTEVIDLLIARGDNVNAIDNNGTTPLLFAISYRQPETAGWLIDNGADISVTNNRGLTPLHYAAARQQNDMVDRLIELGSDINAQTNSDNTPLHYGATMGDITLARKLIESGAELEIGDDHHRTPLLLTARESGSAEMARLLVLQGADINAQDISGDTPLVLAAWRGFESMVDFFLEHGAQLPASAEGRRALIGYAAKSGLTMLFATLVDAGADVDFPSVTGGSLLHDAAAGGSDSIVAMLIRHGKGIDDVDRYGRTPLHHAAERGRVRAAFSLISRGAEIDARSRSGYSPLNVAVTYGRDSVAELLREHGADTAAVSFPQLTGPYLGQKPPGSTPELFAPDIVSSNQFEHGCITFAPDGGEAYWTSSIRESDSGYVTGFILTSRIENGRWILPQLAGFSEIGLDDDIPVLAPDGKRLYFLSRREPRGMWYIERNDSVWSEPLYIQGGPNELGPYWQFSVAANSNIYFGCDGDIWISRFADGAYAKPELLDSTITTPFDEGHPCIAPDESFLIYCTHGYPDSIGGEGIRISFRKSDRRWSKPAKLECDGKPLEGICPVLSPDGRYLFFNNMSTGTADIYWVDVGALIDSLRLSAQSK